MQTQTVHAASAPAMDLVQELKEFATQDVTLRHLKGAEEIATVLHLRGEIDLSAHAAAGADEFARLEKKETSAGLSTRST
jgi:hypothetical protein